MEEESTEKETAIERLFSEAEKYASRGHWDRVVETLEPALIEGAGDGDLHHLLGVAYSELDDLERCRTHFLRTLELDARAEANQEWLDAAAADSIAEQARRVLEELPDEYKQKLGNVLLVLEERPSRELVQEGFDPRAYGLFEGLDHAGQLNQLTAHQVTRIVLFAANLLADFPDPEELAREVRVTVLHEVGHFFGLDEDDLARLGLD